MPNTQLQLRRGTTAEHAVFTGALGELTVNTTTKRLHLHDASTAGGSPMASLADLTTALTPYALTANVHNVPAGGSTGQVLVKTSATDYAVSWAANNLATVQNRTFVGTYTLALGDSYLRLNNNSGNVTLMIPANSTVAFPIGTQITAIWIDCVSVTIDKATGVTLTYPDSLSLRKPGSSVTMTKVGTDAWDIAGDMKVS